MIFLAARGVMALLLLLSGWRVTHWLIALESAGRAPDLETLLSASMRDPGNPEILYRLGLIFRDQPEYFDLEAARLHLDAALDLNPHNWEYWQESARLYELSGDLNSARSALARAVELNSISAIYHWRFANLLLRSGEWEAALAEFRTSLQLDSDFREPTLALLWQSGLPFEDICSIWPDDPAATLFMLRFLAAVSGSSVRPVDPWWLEGLWERLIASNALLTEAQGEFYIQYLLRAGFWDRCRTEWIRLLKKNGRADSGFETGSNRVWNGSFELPVSGGALDWKLESSAALEAARSSGGGRAGSAGLMVSFKGTENLDFAGVAQDLLLEPGTSYLLSFQMQSRELTTEEGVFLQIVDLEPQRVVARSRPVLGTVSWQREEVRFRTGSQSRRARLEMRRHPSRRINNRLGGTLWLDDVRIERGIGVE